MTVALRWLPDSPDMFSATAYSDEDRLHLVVERMPGGGWDWLAWDDAAHPRHGYANDLAGAMSMAERAAGSVQPLWPALDWPFRPLANRDGLGYVGNAFTMTPRQGAEAPAGRGILGAPGLDRVQAGMFS